MNLIGILECILSWSLFGNYDYRFAWIFVEHHWFLFLFPLFLGGRIQNILGYFMISLEYLRVLLPPYLFLDVLESWFKICKTVQMKPLPALRFFKRVFEISIDVLEVCWWSLLGLLNWRLLYTYLFSLFEKSSEW